MASKLTNRQILVATMNACYRQGREMTWCTAPGTTTSMHPATLEAAIRRGELRKVSGYDSPGRRTCRYITVVALRELDA